MNENSGLCCHCARLTPEIWNWGAHQCRETRQIYTSWLAARRQCDCGKFKPKDGINEKTAA